MRRPVANLHANTASVAQISPHVASRMANFASGLARPDFYLTSYPEGAAAREDVYQGLADLLSCDSRSLSLHSSTSAALAKAVLALPQSKRQKIAISASSFASACALAESLVHKGAQVEVTGRPTGYVGIDDLESLSFKPDLLILEWVNHRSGCVSPLDLISRWCLDHGVLLVVDAVQAIGAVPMAFDIDRVGFIAGAAHKWLGGPEGVGFLYTSPRTAAMLEPSLPGYATLKSWPILSTHEPFHRDGRLLETGTLSAVSLIGAAAALAELLASGYHQQLAKIVSTRNLVLEALSQCSRVSILNEPRSDGTSGIISFRVNDAPSAEVVRMLAEAGVTGKDREGIVRLSPAPTVDGVELARRVCEVFSQNQECEG